MAARFAKRVALLLARDGRWLSLIGSTEGPERDWGPPRRSARDVIDAIERAITRFLMMRDNQERIDALRALIARLTPRERTVLELVVQGRMNKQIAYALGTTERTIKAHRHQVMAKVGVRSLAELVSIAEHAGLTGRSHDQG